MKFIKNSNTISNQKWCVYSHYDQDDEIQDFVLETIQRLAGNNLNIVFVSTSKIESCSNLNKLSTFCHTIIERDNIGYDFGSYKTGIFHIHELDKNPQFLIITNDSVYGPLFPIDNIIRNASEYDLYGITDSIDGAYHIQSYFIIYNNNVLRSDHFWNFWNSVELIDKKTKDFKLEIIKRYEIGGSQFFIKNGYKLGAEFAIDALIRSEFNEFLNHIENARSNTGEFNHTLNTTLNSVHYRWRSLIEAKCPFIKRELLALNPAFIEIDDWPQILSSKSGYPVNQIIESIRHYLKSDDFIYTTISIKKIARLLNISGYVKLPCSLAFEDYRIKHNLPQFKEYIFDEDFYRNKYPDVDHVIKLGGLNSAVFHFLIYGYNENRSFKLIPMTNK